MAVHARGVEEAEPGMVVLLLGLAQERRKPHERLIGGAGRHCLDLFR